MTFCQGNRAYNFSWLQHYCSSAVGLIYSRVCKSKSDKGYSRVICNKVLWTIVSLHDNLYVSIAVLCSVLCSVSLLEQSVSLDDHAFDLLNLITQYSNSTTAQDYFNSAGTRETPILLNLLLYWYWHEETSCSYCMLTVRQLLLDTAALSPNLQFSTTLLYTIYNQCSLTVHNYIN